MTKPPLDFYPNGVLSLDSIIKYLNFCFWQLVFSRYRRIYLFGYQKRWVYKDKNDKWRLSFDEKEDWILTEGGFFESKSTSYFWRRFCYDWKYEEEIELDEKYRA